MKKFTPALLFLFIVTAVSSLFAQEMTYSNFRDGNGITLRLSLNSYEVMPLNYRGETMHEISLSGVFIPNEAGMPNLPRISRFVAIPQGAEVKVSIKSMETETLGDINIAPALRIQAIPEEPVTDYVKDERTYSADEFYPQNPVEISEITSIRGVNAVVVGITPFQFNSVTKELIVIRTIELEVEYIGGSRAFDDPKYRSPWFDPILKNAFLNYESLPEIEYPAKSSKDGEGCEYLIIIPNREDFQPYAEQIKDFRTKQGIYTKIMRLDEMGVSTTTQLKSYIHNAYNTWDIPPVAVLLMADHNTNMSLGIPAETISHDYSGSCITDNQYADINGNLLPEMVFSRMAAENETQMAILVSKFLEYETQPCMDPSYYQKPITALGWQTERWFQLCSEVAGGYWRNQGKTPVRINAIYQGTPGNSWSSNQNTSMIVNYFGPNGTGYIPATPSELGGWSGGTAAQVVTAVNNGAFALQHRDHGFEDGWGEPDFTTPNISQLTNVGKMTYLFTINCLTGKFNHSYPCFGEVFHRHTYQGGNAGCVGYLGPTEVSFSFVNDAFAWGMYDLFDPNFMPSYGFQGPHAAAYSGNWMPAFGNVSGKYFLYQSNWPYNSGDKNITYQMFTAHSDVFLRIFTEVPQALNVSHAEVALAGVSNFMIAANEGALIALTAEIDGTLEILAVATATGEMQVMTIPSTLIPNTEINVVITGQNFLRYENVVMVVPAEGPYLVPVGYSVVEENRLTYISTNREITVTLKNVGIEPNQPATVTISCDDPQITINNATATCGNIAPDGTATVNFNVTIANDIPNNKNFLVNLIATENSKGRSWESKMTLKAYAPVFALEKVLLNGVENADLEKETVAALTAVVTNKGGADAYAVKGVLDILSQYVSLACEEIALPGKLLPAGESIEFTYYIVTSDVPFSHQAGFELLLDAQYERSYAKSFTLSKSGEANYTNPGTTGCNSNDKFTSVIIVKNSDQSVIINNTNAACASNGYQDFTNIIAAFEPGEQYTLKVKVAYPNPVRGWFDFNGNNYFDDNERIIELNCPTANVEYTKEFTIPQKVAPGTHRFRLRTVYNDPNFTPYTGHTYGQTHDYTFNIVEIPPVQNVVATHNENDIIVSWNAPQEETPEGYNVYRGGALLNETPLTETTFSEANAEGVFAYHVTAVFNGNVESSIPQMSNVLCIILPCEIPEELNGIAIDEEKSAILTWSEPKGKGSLLGYNIYRDEVKLNDALITAKEYHDEALENGTYTYKVSAVYELMCEESDLTDGVEVTINYVGITNIQTASYRLFPNPTNGNVTIEGDGLNRVEIYDIQGRHLAEYHNVNGKLQWNVKNYENGIYFVRLLSETGEVVVKRLVVIK
ncbi:MAG: C25 family cysteine peptidase [Lentimicrobiaceae bacterium]|nr:C25 family cysteine peptidase [Lentimicrobiaceae bacterium]